ncbi:ATP-binding cassette domain-containing protein [Streptococcus jiangjianxini]|uniref:ATP-binding cassette domain-containing protein n=1 Tax=Streptococcus jiangjianxini TaxID=3161189 RepID=UPI0032ED35B8
MHITIKKLSKNYGDKDVLKDISFAIPSGSICGLLGVNGAGKSTLMKIIFGLEKETTGEILFDNYKQKDEQDNNKIGALIDLPAIYMNLSAFDNLKTKALLYGITDEKIREVLKIIGLENTGRKKASKFSLGMKQRLGLGMAILTNPKLLILDEPTNGLDPDGTRELLGLLKSLQAKGMTILISSHQLHEISKVADNIVILNNGCICYDQPNDHTNDLENIFFNIVHGGLK